jgi:hypothetical protein
MTADRNGNPLRFEGIEFDPRTGEIWKEGSRTVLPDQLFRVLAMLVREHGSLVARDDLRRVLWPDDTFVDFEQGLNAVIKRLREVPDTSGTAAISRSLARIRAGHPFGGGTWSETPGTRMRRWSGDDIAAQEIDSFEAAGRVLLFINGRTGRLHRSL